VLTRAARRETGGRISRRADTTADE